MYRTYLYVCCLLGLVMTGCNHSQQELAFAPPRFKDTVNLKGRVINDSFMMGIGYDIHFYKDYLIVGAYKGEEEEAVHFFRLSDGSYLKSILPKGRGPGEAIWARDLDVDSQSGEVLFYDMMGRKLVGFNIDSVIAHENAGDYVRGKDYPVYMYNAYGIKEGYLAQGGLKLKTGETLRFSVIKNDSVISRYCTFPPVTIPQAPEGTRICYRNNSHISLSPDRSKFACVSNFCAILEIFEIRKDQILLNTIRGFYPPEFTVGKNETIVLTPQTRVGFSELYTTGKYIYTCFCNEPENYRTTEIAVFDWSGNCVRLYRADYYLDKICVDEANHKLYAICQNKEFETVLVEFDLNEE